jgi:hypothetical protein
MCRERFITASTKTHSEHGGTENAALSATHSIKIGGAAAHHTCLERAIDDIENRSVSSCSLCLVVPAVMNLFATSTPTQLTKALYATQRLVRDEGIGPPFGP